MTPLSARSPPLPSTPRRALRPTVPPACSLARTVPRDERVAAVRVSPERVKGVEFDLVMLSDPQTWGGDVEGAVDRYVSMTRATQQLVVLTSNPAGA